MLRGVFATTRATFYDIITVKIDTDRCIDDGATDRAVSCRRVDPFGATGRLIDEKPHAGTGGWGVSNW